MELLLKQLSAYTKGFNKDEKDIETLDCIFQSKKIKGILKLRETCLFFHSNDGKMSLYLPFNEVETVDMELKMISKTLSIETTSGLLQFLDLTEGGVKKFYVCVSRSLDVFRGINQDKPVDSNKIVLSDDEIDYIKKRRTNIEKDL